MYVRIVKDMYEGAITRVKKQCRINGQDPSECRATPRIFPNLFAMCWPAE